MSRTWGRLPDRSDFLRVAAHGIRQGTPGFLLQAAPGKDEGLRIGFTASRKIGNAVTRNRAKRRLRAAADAAFAAAQTHVYDLVLIARPNAVSRDFAAMTADLRTASEKAARQLQRRTP
jgi:ribonuclease P protein component